MLVLLIIIIGIEFLLVVKNQPFMGYYILVRIVYLFFYILNLGNQLDKNIFICRIDV